MDTESAHVRLTAFKHFANWFSKKSFARLRLLLWDSQYPDFSLKRSFRLTGKLRFRERTRLGWLVYE
jgi:hypothetical protein